MTTLPVIEGRPRVLGVFAHPDDESFCAGGTFARYAAAGSEIMVVSATRGQAGQIRSANLATRKTLAEVREAELRLACARLGVKHVQCWDYGDGRLAEIDAADLTARIARTIQAFRPDAVFTFSSDGAYGHPDHIAISQATTAACFDGGRMEHGGLRLYHAAFPPQRRLLLDHLVKWLTEDSPGFMGDPEFVHGLLLLAEEASTLRYVDDHHEVKWFPSGFPIVEQGEPATALFLLLSGHADVVREDARGRRELVTRLHPGQFFGEQGIASRSPRNAHVVAVGGATCLVLSPQPPTLFEGRGEGARLVSLGSAAPADPEVASTTIALDVADFVQPKLGALAAYRSQFPLRPDLLPEKIFRDLFGIEYFTRLFPVGNQNDADRWSTAATDQLSIA